MTCGQLTLSQLIRLLFPARLLFIPPPSLPPPLALISPFCLQPLSRESALCSHCLSISFVSLSLSVLLHFSTISLSLPLTCSLTAPSTGQFSFRLHLCISKRLKEWGHFTITLYHPCCSLSKSGEKLSLPSPGELVFEENRVPTLAAVESENRLWPM